MSAGNQCRLFVGGLKSNIAKEDLEQEFARFGQLRDVWVAHNPPGFAFVEYNEEKDALSCMSGMNGAKILGCQIRVEVVKHKPRGGDAGGGGGRGRGRGGGRGGGLTGVGRGGGRGVGDMRDIRDRGYPPPRGAAYPPREYPAPPPRYDDYYRDDYPPLRAREPRDRYVRPYENGAAYGRRTPPGYRSRSPVGGHRYIGT